MARYIQLDADMNSDLRVRKLLRKHGLLGKAIYIECLTEMFRTQNNERCSIKIDDWLYEELSMQFNLDEAVVRAIINTCISIGLLVKDKECEDDCYYSKGFVKRTGKLLYSDFKRRQTAINNYKSKQT